MDSHFPSLAAARRKYFATRGDEDRAALDHIQAVVEDLRDRHEALHEQLRRASGLSDEILDAIEQGKDGDFDASTVRRADLAGDKIAPTAMIEALLPQALFNLEAIVPRDWRDEQSDVEHGMQDLISGKNSLSLVKGLRPEAEASPLHRFRQMLRVSRDWLDQDPSYDIFAGSLLVSQLVALGTNLPLLADVGNAESRIRRLWEGPSEQVDAVVFELLVAAACAQKGRRIDFIEETFERTADLKVHDPYPMLIECKRQRSLSDYERAEEVIMRRVFALLEGQADQKAAYGGYQLELTVDASEIEPDEVVRELVGQRFAPHPERARRLKWGTVGYNRHDMVIQLPETTRPYSPNLLEHLFDWRSDLPDWDGLVCRMDGAGKSPVDAVRKPIALLWRNISDQAVKKRAWSPTNLLGSAMRQIAPGEFGMVYLAHVEGARGDVADLRFHETVERIADWEHSSNIRVPLGLLTQLHPRPLGHGAPDMIERGLRFVSQTYGIPELFRKFPTRIFTLPDADDQ